MRKKEVDMPQLDKVTFLSQFFWLSVFYLGFYIVIVKQFLPKLARILKFRQKKMTLSQKGVETLSEEQSKVRESFDTLVQRGVFTSKTLFVETLDKTTQWVDQTLLETNRKELNASNLLYLSSLGTVNLEKQLALSFTFPKFSETLFLAHLADRLKQFSTLSPGVGARYLSKEGEKVGMKVKKK